MNWHGEHEKVNYTRSTQAGKGLRAPSVGSEGAGPRARLWARLRETHGSEPEGLRTDVHTKPWIPGPLLPQGLPRLSFTTTELPGAGEPSASGRPPLDAKGRDRRPGPRLVRKGGPLWWEVQPQRQVSLISEELFCRTQASCLLLLV